MLADQLRSVLPRQQRRLPGGRLRQPRDPERGVQLQQGGAFRFQHGRCVTRLQSSSNSNATASFAVASALYQALTA